MKINTSIRLKTGDMLLIREFLRFLIAEQCAHLLALACVVISAADLVSLVAHIQIQLISGQEKRK